MSAQAEFLTLALAESQGGPVLVGGREAGWWEPFHDPLLDGTVLRLWLDAAPLGPADLHLVSEQLVAGVSAAAGTFAGSPRLSMCAVEANRVFPIRGTEAASVLLALRPRGSGCRQCAWRQTGCDEWFVEQLVESFAAGCLRLGTEVDPLRVQRYVEHDLAPIDGWQWWSRWTPGSGRSGVVISSGHEDVVDGRAYTQCVDAVGRYTSHVSCLAGELTRTLGAEVRGEITIGADWLRERTVLRRLHADGWRIRGLTSVFPGPAEVQPAPAGIERR